MVVPTPQLHQAKVNTRQKPMAAGERSTWHHLHRADMFLLNTLKLLGDGPSPIHRASRFVETLLHARLF